MKPPNEDPIMLEREMRWPYEPHLPDAEPPPAAEGLVYWIIHVVCILLTFAVIAIVWRQLGK